MVWVGGKPCIPPDKARARGGALPGDHTEAQREQADWLCAYKSYQARLVRTCIRHLTIANSPPPGIVGYYAPPLTRTSAGSAEIARYEEQHEVSE